MTETRKIRVLLADDHALFSDGLVLQLSAGNSPVEVVGQVFRGEDVRPAVLRHAPDVVLLDINLPTLNGIDCARQLRKDAPTVRLIMLTMYAYRKFIDECRQMGVSGYLLKSERADVIIGTICRVQNGETVFPEMPNNHAHDKDEFVRRFKLTPTEVKIIRLIHQGLSSQQIAERLFVSFDTVRSHRKNIYRKLEINHLSELLTFAGEFGLVADTGKTV
ncbi:response regulator transcription factor [Nibrella viscosa]|uniref:Response regulator transcription factor n=1 Tax=Nibrella viscosa TaxID=1084524 RepID=A0ABP8KSI3_9BACT